MLNLIKRFGKNKEGYISLNQYSPSNIDLYNVCMSYRHDFGLLTEKEQNNIRVEAKEWLEAWGKILTNFKLEK